MNFQKKCHVGDSALDAEDAGRRASVALVVTRDHRGRRNSGCSLFALFLWGSPLHSPRSFLPRRCCVPHCRMLPSFASTRRRICDLHLHHHHHHHHLLYHLLLQLLYRLVCRCNPTRCAVTRHPRSMR